jgi:hypothetical protein
MEVRHAKRWIVSQLKVCPMRGTLLMDQRSECILLEAAFFTSFCEGKLLSS